MFYQENLLLQYYISTGFPPVWQRMANARYLRPLQGQVASHEIVQQTMSNELHIVTLLASMASRTEHLDKRSVQPGQQYLSIQPPLLSCSMSLADEQARPHNL